MTAACVLARGANTGADCAAAEGRGGAGGHAKDGREEHCAGG